jgi:hypothetical protein
MQSVRAGRLSVAIVVAGYVLALTSVAGGVGRVATPTVRLDSGLITKFRWSAFASRARGPNGGRRPCLTIGLQRVHRPPVPDPLEIPIGDTSCGSVRPVPNVLGVVDEVDRPQVNLLIMGFDSRVRSVALFFSGSLGDKQMPLRLLSQGKAAKARIQPFRYGAFVFRGRSCLTRFVAHSQTGRVVDDSGYMRCR